MYIIFPQFLKKNSMTLWNLQDIKGRLSLLWDHKNWSNHQDATTLYYGLNICIRTIRCKGPI